MTMTGDDSILRVDVSELSLVARTSGPQFALTVKANPGADAGTSNGNVVSVEIIFEISDVPPITQSESRRCVLPVDPTSTRLAPSELNADVVADVATLNPDVAHTHPSSSARLRTQRDRGLITKGTLIIYGLLLGALLLLVGLHLISVGDSLQLITGFGAPLVGLLGACAGYYFGRKVSSH